jgi:hypothetical protein
MKTKLLALALLAGSTMFAETRFSIGVNLGGYGRGYYAPAPPVYASVAPPCPGPDYTWVDGYWSQNTWVAGYWNRPAYYQAAPRYEQRSYENRYYRNGYVQQGFNRGFGHDRDRDHDYRRNNGYRGR